MDKRNIAAYWNLARVIRTIPEKAFETDPRAQQTAEMYFALYQEYGEYLRKINTHEKEDNGKQTVQ